MWEYLRQHEAFVRNALLGEPDSAASAELAALHGRQLAYMQHERIIHLLVTLFVALFWLMTIGFVATHESWAGLTVSTFLLVLLVAYVIHYYRLENGVQRFYTLANEIEAGRSELGRRYQGRA